jgi:hypothetical protein
MADSKDTVYIDVDDEITGIIDKVLASKHKIVALVLPKRAAVLQSIVNMKLLKRSAEDANKRVVLITSEANLLPLAGAVGLYAAKTLQSKPAIPAPPDTSQAGEALVDDEEIGEAPELDENKSVGELAGLGAAAAAGAKASAAPTEETIDVDNTDPTPDKKKKAKKSKGKGGGLVKVPNFEGFRSKLFLGVLGVILLIVLWVFAFMVLPKAKITVKADTSTVNVNANFTADTSATAVDTDKMVTPAVLKQYPKTDSQTVPATGQKDIGTKASGSVTMTAQKCSGNPFVPPSDIPAGSGVSTNGKTYITQSTTSFHGTSASGSCYNYVSDSSTDIVAQSAGDSYNVSNATFTVAGRSDASASGSASGGTTQVVKVVQQSDIDAAKQQILDKNRDPAKSELNKQFQSGDAQPVLETFSNGNPTVTSSANANDQADSVTVTEKITYTMLGVKKDDLKKLIEADVKSQIDTNKQPIQDYGMDKISFQVLSGSTPEKAKLVLQTQVIAGVKLDFDALKKQVAGKKKGDVQQIIGGQTGVTDVQVSYSPFWVSSTPKKTSKITIVLEQNNDAQK